MGDTVRAIIADDEPLARRGIRQLLQRHPDVTVVAEARNGKETLWALREFKPDLLFLDIQMPDLDGFDVLRKIDAKLMPVTVFVTAYDQFAVRAFDAYALDYLLKPLKEARLSQALDRVRERLRTSKAVDMSRRLLAMLDEREKQRSRQRILVPTAGGNVVVDPEEIDWIEADDCYAIIHTGTRWHLIRESLNSLEQRLNKDQFVRTHRSAIVNVAHVREMVRLRESGRETGETAIVLVSGARVPVSRRRRALVSSLLRRLNK